MLSTNINNLTLHELSELLVANTIELLNLVNQKGSDGYLIRDKKADVEMIKSVITKKKLEDMASP